jgi:hypothetical protein
MSTIVHFWRGNSGRRRAAATIFQRFFAVNEFSKEQANAKTKKAM